MILQEHDHRNSTHALSPFEASYLALISGDRIDRQWQQFFTIILLALGYVTSNLTNIHLIQACILAFGISSYVVFSAVALTRQYKIISIAADESVYLLSKFGLASNSANEAIKNQAFRFRFPLRIFGCWIVHLIGASAINYLVFKGVPVPGFEAIPNLF
jgi:hypothetical protein